MDESDPGPDRHFLVKGREGFGTSCGTQRMQDGSWEDGRHEGTEALPLVLEDGRHAELDSGLYGEGQVVVVV